MDNFTIRFNKGRQWITVQVWDVHPITFKNWGGGRWAYFDPTFENPKVGLFGELHLVKSGIREDTLAHELLHVVLGWCFANWIIPTPRNEEKLCEFIDELTRKFWKGYRKK
jgi:hypothetical protein